MSHSATIGHIEVPVTWSPEEAVGLMQEHGIVGAGGAGFPTYLKYQQPPSTLLVNGCDSEPGYYADKLLMRDEPEALFDVLQFLNDVFSIDTAIVCAEDVARPYMDDLERMAEESQEFSISYIEPRYKYGQERALCKAVLGMEIGPKEIPPQHGIVVSNVESLFNVYRSVFRDRPVTTKFLQVFGEARPLRVYEAPIGTLAVDLLRIHGTPASSMAGCKLYDGGPILADLVADPMGDEPMAPVKTTTNGILVVDPAKDRPRKDHYPDPAYEHNTVDAPWAPRDIINIEHEVDRVRIPLQGRFWEHGPLVVESGDDVAVGDTLAAPAVGKRSIGVHASIPGFVKAITEDHIEIWR